MAQGAGRVMAAPCYAGKRGRSRKVADNELQGTGGFGGRVTHGGTLYERAEREQRRLERESDAAWSAFGALLSGAWTGVERAMRAVADPLDVDECSWCGDLWTVEDMHDLTDFRDGSVILVCEVCDSTGG